MTAVLSIQQQFVYILHLLIMQTLVVALLKIYFFYA